MNMTGAQIIIEVLLHEGVDCLFGYPGGTVLNIYDELYKNSHRIHHYITCHEQGAVHAADGYARASGKVGVCLATSGPGATNLITGIATAYLDSVPMVAITGNVPTALIGRDSFQEVDITGITMPITKHNYTVRDVSKLASILREAFAVARSDRPGPVLVDVPKDIQMAVFDYQPAPDVNRPFGAPEDEELEEAATVIAQAKKPFLYVGGGVVSADACEEVRELSRLLEAPIGTTMMGQSAVSHSDAAYLGMVGMHGTYAANRIINDCDLIIALGVRFSERATGNKKAFVHNRKVLHFDIDPAEIGKNIPAYTSLVGDVKKSLQRLLPKVKAKQNADWHAHTTATKTHPDNNLPHADHLTPRHIIEAVRDRMPEDGLVATDVGQHQMWTAQHYAFSRPRTFITSGGLGAMGFGMGGAIGACLAQGKKRTVLFTSDGSFHMNLNEMATAVSNDLPLVVIMLDNNALGMVRQWQTLFFDKRYYQTTLSRKTDYVLLAQSFGANALRVSSLDELDGALDAAFAQSGPVLIHCLISPDEKVLPMIPPGGTIDDIILR